MLSGVVIWHLLNRLHQFQVGKSSVVTSWQLLSGQLCLFFCERTADTGWTLNTSSSQMSAVLVQLARDNYKQQQMKISDTQRGMRKCTVRNTGCTCRFAIFSVLFSLVLRIKYFHKHFHHIFIMVINMGKSFPTINL